MLGVNTPLVCIRVSNIQGDGLQQSDPVIAFRGFNLRCMIIAAVHRLLFGKKVSESF